MIPEIVAFRELFSMAFNGVVKALQCTNLYSYTCIHTYIPTYLPTYLLTYVRTYVRTYVLAYVVCVYVCMYVWGGPKIKGPFVGGPHNLDCRRSIFGSKVYGT